MQKINKLKLGIPKGSLQNKTIEVFKNAGFDIYVNSRSYFPTIDDTEIELTLLRAQEMSRYVEDGVLDCGITGEDWILENSSDVKRLAELPYAKQTLNSVRWVVAVRADSKIKKIEDLDGKRVATELVGYTRKYFKKRKINVDLEFSWGATEFKVTSGLVDAIVDITETGSSLRANNLRIVDTLCYSTTQFIANKAAYKDLWKQKKMEYILLLLKGALEAKGKVGLKLNIRKNDIDNLLKILPALKRPTISQLADASWAACEVIIEEKDVRN
ncbi:MAG: ATP phosphoribosyltransferase, partial [Candidatus Omnitrophota bacterium]